MDRYQLVRSLGKGGNGEVFLVFDNLLNRYVAINKINPIEGGWVQHELIEERFLREVRAMGSLRHPNVAQVYNIAREDGVLYIVMEFIQGKTLQQELETPKPFEWLLRVLEKVAAVLDLAHEKYSIIHRDIKTSNIMITDDNEVKVLDWGSAKFLGQTITPGGLILGTFQWMAPEQLAGQPASRFTDQFALAEIAYQGLTHRQVFEALTVESLLTKIIFEQPEPPHHINTALNPGVSTVLARALSKDPSKRYPTCADFVNELKCAVGRSSGAPLVGPDSAELANGAPRPETRSACLFGGRAAAPLVALLSAVIGGSAFVGRAHRAVAVPGSGPAGSESFESRLSVFEGPLGPGKSFSSVPLAAAVGSRPVVAASVSEIEAASRRSSRVSRSGSVLRESRKDFVLPPPHPHRLTAPDLPPPPDLIVPAALSFVHMDVLSQPRPPQSPPDRVVDKHGPAIGVSRSSRVPRWLRLPRRKKALTRERVLLRTSKD